MKKLKLDFEIPSYLEHDINEYVKARNDSTRLDWDCWWGEVYGSINMAMSSRQITEEQAERLRAYYLYKENHSRK